MLEGVGLGERDGAPAVLVAVEQPMHPLLGAVLPVEVLHLSNKTNPSVTKYKETQIVQGLRDGYGEAE